MAAEEASRSRAYAQVGLLARIARLRRTALLAGVALLVAPPAAFLIWEWSIARRDLARSEAFYRDVLGLEEGLRDEARRWLFLRAGGSAGMIVLQEDQGDWPTQHFAFTAAASEMERAVDQLRAKGVSTVGPMIHDWIPAKSVYFSDPDGHDLELCAPLEK